MIKFYALIGRLKTIRRWSLMRSAIPENVAEHSHMTAVLAHALAVIGREYFGRDCDPDAIATAALYHDAGEILTGDLPTPIKYYNRDLMQAYRGVEEMAGQRLLAALPERLRPAYEPLLAAPTDDYVRRVLKAADKFSAYIKCAEERRAGNDEFSEAERKTLERIRSLELPEAEFFLEHCLPAFDLTLDALGTLEYDEVNPS